ncbi:hypothetical protein C8J57DRAFT_1724219 [Mycena rebaudengoi]|nr:hypothetical protein C8J57DRAFT_1724219 [Mycena rebaudengoi]
MHDASDSFAQPRCHPQTRTEMLEKLMKWSTTSQRVSESSRFIRHKSLRPPSVIWIYGPAGAGKSAIMRTLSGKLAEVGCLGGSFFFKRGHATRGNAQTLFATLAYQLALNMPQLKVLISQVVEDIPYVVAKSLDVQLQKLIVEPCGSLDISPQLDISPHPTIIIDGLDECEDPRVQQEILRLIAQSASREHCRSPKFLIASRPEPHIREMFEDPFFKGLSCPFNVEQSFKDVETYFCDQFARIHREHRQTMAAIPRPWPSQEVIWRLVSKSSGYFIYAATVIKFIDDRNFRPTEQLARLWKHSCLESPFSALDQLYTQILSTVPARSRLLSILGTLLFWQFCLTPNAIEQLLELDPGDVQLVLRGVHSVLDIPDPADDELTDIRVYHASFQDFLDDATRAGEFYVGGPHHRVDAARCVLKLLSYKFNNPSSNRAGPFAFSRGLEKWIAKMPPAAELVPFVGHINPAFIFHRFDHNGTKKVLFWLNNFGEGVPADLLQLWEDYDFMGIFQSAIYDLKWRPLDDPLLSDRDCTEVFTRSPLLARVFQAYILGDRWKYVGLVQIHFLLDIPWDDLRTAICSLKPIVGADQVKIRALLKHVAQSLSPATSMDTLSSELARGFLRMLKSVSTGQQPEYFWASELPWGLYIRSSPHSPGLLQHIHECISFTAIRRLKIAADYPNNYYHVVQWLKAYPDPPQELINTWQRYLMAAYNSYKLSRLWTESDFNEEWRTWEHNKKMQYPNSISHRQMDHDLDPF